MKIKHAAAPFTYTLYTMNIPAVYANYFYDTSVIFSNSFITYREPFRFALVMTDEPM